MEIQWVLLTSLKTYNNKIQKVIFDKVSNDERTCGNV